MQTQSAIEDSVRDNLSIIFGKAESVEHTEFLQRYTALVDYAGNASEPVLKEETIRYQSILLYVSLLFISISLFEIGKVKIGETLISTDEKLLVIYAIFIIAVAAIFLIKAFVDYQRAMFVRAKNEHVIDELRHVMNIGWLRRQIQEYFWLEISNAIGRAYKNYSDAKAKALNYAEDFQVLDINYFNLDLNQLREIPELAIEVSKQETYLASCLTAALGKDEEGFHNEIESTDSSKSGQSGDWEERYETMERVRRAFDQNLERWFEARSKLTWEHSSLTMERLADMPEEKQMKAMLAVLERLRRIRRAYAVLEVFAPVGFALFVLIYVWLF